MSTGMFAIREGGQLVEMTAAPYVTEDELQQLLASHPSLIPGDQIDPESPRRWLLVTREMGVPDAPGAADRWSLDHLFLDQEAVPTLVEVKRATDTRARREVVAQMLDYASNGPLHWDVDILRREFEDRCRREQRDPDAELETLLRGSMDAEAFWRTVRTNLQAGRIRMLFVADEISPELRRIVEFLNRQMDLAEVLAVEVRKFEGPGLQTLVPRVCGQTEQALEKKSGTGRRSASWDEGKFFACLEERGDQVEVKVARALFDWATQRFSRMTYGTGELKGSAIPVLDTPSGWYGPFRIYTGDKAACVQIPLQGSGLLVPPMQSPETIGELVDRLNTIPGVSIARDAKYPNIPLTVLATGGSMDRFLAAIEWAVQRVKSSAASATSALR